LTIAGSDSGGGAGIQADLKTFAALGVHGACAITAITAQNTRTVTAIQDVDARIVKAQINTVVNDIGIDAVKTGMLHTSEIIGIVAQEIRSFKIPTVVDPVMVAKSGAKLLHDDAVSSLKRELLPDATVATPNAPEATVLSGIKVDSVEAAKEAARKISSMGPVGVVVKGGHIPYRGKVADVLYVNGEYHVFETEELPSRTTHGTGCTFSSAIAAYMARGENVTQAVKLAKVFVQDAIRFGVLVGEGVGPVNPMASLYKEAEKHKIWSTSPRHSDCSRVLQLSGKSSRKSTRILPWRWSMQQTLETWLVFLAGYYVWAVSSSHIPAQCSAVHGMLRALFSLPKLTTPQSGRQ